MPRFAFTALALLALVSSATAQEAGWLSQARADVDSLTSDAFSGRGYADDGAARAAAFVARRMAAVGLEPVGDAFAQPFGFETDLIDGALLIVGTDTLRMGVDVLPYAGSAAADVSGAFVDAGDGTVGLVDPSQARALVSGKIAVVTADVPESMREMLPAAVTIPGARASVLARSGAKAVVVLVDDVMYGPAAFDLPIPMLTVRREAWPLDATSARIVVRSRSNAGVQASNVVGRVRGTGEGAPLLVLAHYDHLGSFADLSDSSRVIFRGANDNASGTALLLALAKSISSKPPRRDVLFAAVGGEEQGLKGADVLHDAMDGAPLAAVLNFDMVASGENGLLAFGGSDFPGLFARAQSLADSLGVGPITPRPNRANSDHFPFLNGGTPGLYLLTSGGTQPYHSTGDVPETLEWDDFSDVYRLALALLHDLGH